MTPKRMELLREIVPRLRRVAILWNAADPGMTLIIAAKACSKSLGSRTPNSWTSKAITLAPVSDAR